MSAPAAALPPLPRRILMVLLIEGVPFAGAVTALLLAARDGIYPADLPLFFGFYLFTMTGVELGFHRLLAHRHFETTPTIWATLLAAGSMAGEGSPLLWSAVHRVHHAHADAPGDPHSPVLGRTGFWARLAGFLHVQFLWYTRVSIVARFRRLVRDPAQASAEETRYLRAIADLARDPLIRAVDARYGLWVALGYALPTAIGGLAAGSWTGALHGLLWGGFLRDFVVKQVTFAINSVGHTIGRRAHASRDASRNNPVMALLTLGAGWHNDHHAHPGAALVGFRWWQIDLAGGLIRALRRAGLAWNVRERATSAAR